MLHGVKQLVGMLATPLLLAVLIAASAAIFRLADRRRSSTSLFALAAIVAYFGATSLVANALLLPLERAYPPLHSNIAPAPTHIVVLGSYYAPRDDLPVTAALGSDGLVRIVEGVRLARIFPKAQLIVSGGVVSGYAPSAEGYAKLARELGIASERIRVIDTPRDTKEEAAAVTAMIGSTPFLLVTSAAHMPRSMRLMLAAGARPLAAPTAHRVDVSRWSWRSLLPFGSSLRNTEAALHEYVGLLALSMGLQ
jgi:uncharacterized SAM-binding protein YcdF (DUF218 family)